MSEPTHITIRGAREHNLCDVDLDIPRNALVVFTGVSGSGKSSLAHDTVFKEGQRRYLESLSAYARQFLGQMERPAADRVDGVSPTLSIDQKTVNRNPRSTVGTVTEIYDHLRLMMARLGTPHCPECGQAVSRLSVDQVVDRLQEEFDGERALVLSPVIQDRKGEYRQQMAEWHRDGWLRARVDGDIVRLDEPPELARYEKHTLEIVVDRMRIGTGDRARLSEAVTTAVRMGHGSVAIHLPDREEADRDRLYSTDRSCPNHPEVAIPELEPRLFSFNAPQGACPDCGGLGVIEDFDLTALIDLGQPGESCFNAFNDEGRLPFAHFDEARLAEVVQKVGGKPGVPVKRWTSKARKRLIFGDASLILNYRVDRGGRSEQRSRPWRGLLGLVENVWRYTHYRPLGAFRTRVRCDGCEGQRLNAVARAVTFRGQAIPAYTGMSVEAAHAFFQALELGPSETEIGAPLLAEVRERLRFLQHVGLGYLTLDRSAATLSGGEAQRIRLAAQVGSALQGVTYILDEPSIGLHARDNARLLEAIRELRDRGNSVLVVEHDEETIRSADWVVDVGPGAGRQGGRIAASGPPGRVARVKDSLTARWLRGDRRIALPESRRTGSGMALGVRGARVNNLDGVDVDFPLGMLLVVTGVSGSGKSSLVFEVLEASWRSIAGGGAPVRCQALEGADQIDKLITISQSPIGRTPRSNPATYTGVFDPIRTLFSQTPEARARGYKKGRFSFNVSGGRCEACSGAGVITVEMQFLPSVDVPCEVCSGKRFNRETLEIRWKGLNIHEVLSLTVAEAAEVFAPIPKIARILTTMVEVGLGYVSLGQPSTTLSGGEAQRVKLATELHRPATGSTLYLLDEPTTGLHFEDVARLLKALQRLVDAGNSVVVIEHHTDVIKCADHLVDMGPEGGSGGGQLVGWGTPEHVATRDTPTGRVLAELPEFASPDAGPQTQASPSRRRRSPSRAGRGGAIEVRGAAKHNLRGVDCTIPHGSMTVVTGVSGSGKTSLAFDTVFSEGQRQYVESLSTYARRFLGRLERPPVQSVEGLQPSIAIDQKARSHNPRSTVATVTECHDTLRILWSRVGIPHCPQCDRPIRSFSPSTGAAHLAAEASGTGWIVAPLAPVKQEVEARRLALVAEGWTRLLTADGEVRLDDSAANAALGRGVDLVIDRLNPARASSTRLAEAVGAGFRMGLGTVRFQPRREGEPIVLTEQPTCEVHGPVFDVAPEPRHFSFNSQLGACPRCSGLGTAKTFAARRVLPVCNHGVFDALDGRVSGVLGRSPRNRAILLEVLASFGLTAKDPVSSWSKEAYAAVMNGTRARYTVTWKQRWGRTVRTVEEEQGWPGLIAVLEGWRSRLEWLSTVTTCPGCQGGRLRPELLAVRIDGEGLHTFSARTVESALARAKAWPLEGAREAIAARPREELVRRLAFLVDVGLGYLTLDRSADTLSGGEAQRIRLASQLGSGLVGVTYVLDEPTIGLHPRDTDRLMGTLEGLRDLGNTVVVVEHDPDTIRRADHVLDMGPAAGAHGGRLCASGTPEMIAANPESVTGRWLSGEQEIAVPQTRRKAGPGLTLHDPTGHNLRCGDVHVPSRSWVAVSGVSGSGKSTLVLDTLAEALKANLGLEADPAPHTGLQVHDPIDRLVVVDQRPIGRTPRSTPATYCKLLDPIRKLFAQTPGARQRGWGPGQFSFNSTTGGRCELCEGRGAVLVEMHFLPDVWVQCEGCRGLRYGRETLAVRYRDRSIADVLAMRVDDALELFAQHRGLVRRLKSLDDVGLGYLTLGQPATTLSGGEAQRIKLAAELAGRRGHCAYVLDEPTTGLHLADVARLVEVLHRLVDAGHTVVTIEHHLDVLAQSDWLIELGPDGGEAGGQVVALGTPEQVAAGETCTGQALRAQLGRTARG